MKISKMTLVFAAFYFVFVFMCFVVAEVAGQPATTTPVTQPTAPVDAILAALPPAIATERAGQAERYNMLNAAYAANAAALAAANGQVTAAKTALAAANARIAALANVAAGQPTTAPTPLGAGADLAAVLAAAKPGTVVLAGAETWHTALVVPAGVTLRAVGTGAVIDGDGVRPVLGKGGANAVIENVKFIHAKSAVQQAAVEPGPGWLLINCEANENNESGFTTKTDNVSFVRCAARRNGRSGFKGGFAHNVFLSNCIDEQNNTANFSTGFEAGAGKWHECDGITILNCICRDNNGFGWWFDGKNKNVVVRGGSVTGNRAWDKPDNGCGVMVEISEGPFTIDGVTFSGNGGGDVNVCESQLVTVTHCRMGKGLWVRNMPNRPPGLGPIFVAGNTLDKGATMPPGSTTRPAPGF